MLAFICSIYNSVISQFVLARYGIQSLPLNKIDFLLLSINCYYCRHGLNSAEQFKVSFTFKCKWIPWPQVKNIIMIVYIACTGLEDKMQCNLLDFFINEHRK